MKNALFFLIILLTSIVVHAQVPEPANNNSEQQLENSTANSDDAETEDDSYLQAMVQYLKNPINLNTANENLLKEIKLLNALQIANLINYRNLLGSFISIYELQSVPGWDVNLIEKLRPYVTINLSTNLKTTLFGRLKNGEHNLLLRTTQVLQKSKGYLIDAASTKNYYAGSPQKIFVRYQYNYKNMLQYGFVGEKDAGEQFFKGNQHQGFDFYSGHFFVKNIGVIKTLALGDFTVNMGQGLIQWQSLAFKKSADVINIKRSAATLRPYTSAGETNFHRGAGITLQKNNWQSTVFVSYKKVDANAVIDTIASTEDYVSSLLTSGYHRTKSEMEDRDAQRQLAWGGNVNYQNKNFQLGINTIHYQFSLPIKKMSDPYNLFALSGKAFSNTSIDYSYTFQNFHFFGEAAVNNNFKTAFVNGLLFSAAPNVDMSILYRNISPIYQTLYTNAFTENSMPNNEKGLYMGISVKPNANWSIVGYADFFTFPWLKYGVDAPSSGSDYLLQFNYKPNKQFEIYTRFLHQQKQKNIALTTNVLSAIYQVPKQNWRTQINFQISPSFTLKNRVELLWYDKKSAQAEQGFLTYLDVLYKPMLTSWAANMRLQYVETDGYNSRIYAYENDVLYSFSIPAFYQKGIRIYLNFNKDINKKINLWAKLSHSLFLDKKTIGSGLDEIAGNAKTEIKLQLQVKF
jgi:Helix-hairpin-helix motif